MPGDYEKGEKEYRVIKLFTRLCETEVGLTTRQLADELEVNTRTVQRYVATLRDNAGIDIEETDGRWRIGKRSLLPPLQLDHYQATLLLVARAPAAAGAHRAGPGTDRRARPSVPRARACRW